MVTPIETLKKSLQVIGSGIQKQAATEMAFEICLYGEPEHRKIRFANGPKLTIKVSKS